MSETEKNNKKLDVIWTFWKDNRKYKWNDAEKLPLYEQQVEELFNRNKSIADVIWTEEFLQDNKKYKKKLLQDLKLRHEKLFNGDGREETEVRFQVER